MLSFNRKKCNINASSLENNDACLNGGSAPENDNSCLDDEASPENDNACLNDDSIKPSVNTKRTFKEWFLEKRLPLILELIKWIIVDIFRVKRYGKELHIYGIWCFVGIYGGGKTISLVEYLERMRNKYGDKILIYTNFFYSGEDGHIAHWDMLLKTYDLPVIFAYDELQNEFNSRDYRSFPTSLMVLLTQNRKGHGKQIVYTTQDYETVDKSFRRLTQKVITCKTLFGRLVHCRTYPRELYDNYLVSNSVDKKLKMEAYVNSRWYVQSDYLRSRYDSFQMLESARNKQYNDREVEK